MKAINQGSCRLSGREKSIFRGGFYGDVGPGTAYHSGRDMFCADNARIGKLEDRWRPIDFIQGIKHSRSLPGLDFLSEIDAGFKKAFMRGVDDAL